MQSEQDTRTFRERVSRTNAAFLVSVPTQELAGKFAQLVEDAVNAVGARLVYVLTSSQRLRIDYDEPRPRRDDRDGERRRRFTFGGDEGENRE